MPETDRGSSAAPSRAQSMNSANSCSRRGLIAGLALIPALPIAVQARASRPGETPIAALRREFDRQARDWRLGLSNMDALAHAAGLLKPVDAADREHLRHMADWSRQVDGIAYTVAPIPMAFLRERIEA